MTSKRHEDVFARDMNWIDSGQGAQFVRFSLDDANAESTPQVVIARFDPDERVIPHTHRCNYLEYIVSGSQKVGKTWFEAGDVRRVSASTGYGPILIGPDGCTVLIVFQEGGKSAPIPLGSAAAMLETAPT